MVDSFSRDAVLGFRIRAQQLDRRSGTVADTALLDFGAQDSGPTERCGPWPAGGSTWPASDRTIWLYCGRIEALRTGTGAPIYRR